ncbi:hypothetical protein [Pseudonocardia humida]|uniref:Uncharacterized protein n=1 Tax=Pseudonocardia humida TaxID=2800819 RepID=A0ABT1A118_9PSEU|nr:hypothetical protein [Pseudonocardia humida]MCO1656698.1 hypothetical protein [Pseudonocardia humida]
MSSGRRTTAAVLAGLAIALGVATATPAAAAEPTGTPVTDREYGTDGTRVTGTDPVTFDRDL